MGIGWGRDAQLQRQRPDGNSVVQEQYLQAYHLIQRLNLHEMKTNDPEA